MILHNSKCYMLSGLLLVSLALAGCTTPRIVSDFLGDERTMPDDSKFDANAKRPPALNPGGAGVIGAEDNTSKSSVAGSSVRRVPVENNVPSAENAAPASVTATASAPVETLPQQVAPANANNNYPALADVPPVPAHTPGAQSSAELNQMNTQHNLAESTRKDVMSDQSATVMTSPQTGQLVDNPANASAPQDPSMKAFIAAPTPVADATPVAAEPAAAAVATPAPEKQTGFTGWLHNLFSSDKTQDTAQIPVRKAPVENADAATMPIGVPAAPDAAPRDLMAAANVPALQAETPAQPMAPAASVVDIAQPVMQPASAPQIAPALAPVQTAEPAPMASAPAAQADLEPVHLHPPVAAQSVGDTPQTDVASQNTAGASPDADAPVHLVAPKNAVNPSAASTHYLPDSRYAARHPSYDMDN